MSRMVIVVFALSFALAFGCTPKVDVGAETLAVTVVLNNYIASIEAENMDLYGRVMAHDSDMINFGTSEDPIRGWDALRKVIEEQNEALSQTKIAAKDVFVHIAPSGKFAWATSMWDFKAVMAGKPLDLPVRCSWILQKRDNDWVIVHFHKSVAEH